ncbi:restriction endonuclease subunit S [Viridibacterium curvum]|uniref:Tyrosinase copper-binding domain-containing protein n=1 Tax=Viridibacterium curvum TaxID=1101404 RepID=A0ABP9QRD3_9RHOO
MTAQTDSKAPGIRFGAFSGDWDEKVLGELFPITSAARVHKNEWTKSGVPFFRSSDVVSHFKGQANAKAFISVELYEELSAKVGRIKKGDMLVTGGGSIGIPFLVENDDPLYFKDADLLWFKIREAVDSHYLYTLLSAAPFRRYLKSISHIGTIAHYTVEQAKGTPVTLPRDSDEQTKIGDYFHELDSLIGLHQRKHEKLVALKKSMLQKMFPQPGATIPEIRFKGFSGEWVDKTLVELCDLFADGDWIESKDQSPSGIRLLQTGNVGINQFIDKADKARWISIDTFERLKCEEVFAGDILISRLPEPAGRACIVPKLLHRVITAVDCTIVRTTKICDPAFLVQHCSLDSHFETVKDFLGGGTRQRISRSALGKFVVKVPEFEEQKQIGNYFRTLDGLITKHATQLQKLQQIKSACLEKMFV